jgi:large subunit ribosomal protein L25
VSALGINDSRHVSDIQVPAGVEVFAEPDATVCVVAPPRVEEVAPVAAEAAGEVEAAAEPELIRKPKEEGEEGEGQ